MKKLTQLFVTFSIAFLAMFGVSALNTPLQITDHTIVHADDVFTSHTLAPTASGSSGAGKIVSGIFTAADYFAGIVLAISIIMIITGGLRYILANGDQRQAEQGKMILIYSGIGIVIALSAFAIAKLFQGLSF